MRTLNGSWISLGPTEVYACTNSFKNYAQQCLACLTNLITTFDTFNLNLKAVHNPWLISRPGFNLLTVSFLFQDPNLPKLCLFSLRDIIMGEELSFDYRQQTGSHFFIITVSIRIPEAFKIWTGFQTTVHRQAINIANHLIIVLAMVS